MFRLWRADVGPYFGIWLFSWQLWYYIILFPVILDAIISFFVTPCCGLSVRFWFYLEIYSVAIDYENTDLINFLHLIEGWGPVWNWGCNKAVERWHWNRGITYSLLSFLIIDWLCLESFWKSYLHVFKKPL